MQSGVCHRYINIIRFISQMRINFNRNGRLSWLRRLRGENIFEAITNRIEILIELSSNVVHHSALQLFESERADLPVIDVLEVARTSGYFLNSSIFRTFRYYYFGIVSIQLQLGGIVQDKSGTNPEFITRYNGDGIDKDEGHNDNVHINERG